MTDKEALKLALEALEANQPVNYCMNNNGERFPMMHEDPFKFERNSKAITAIKAALEAKDEPVIYDKTELNSFVQGLYDKKMQEGKHGHFETMFHCVHQAIKRVSPPQRTWVGLTKKEFQEAVEGLEDLEDCWVAIEAALRSKND